MALLYLKLHYGTIALISLSWLASVITNFIVLSVFGALIATVLFLLVGGLIVGGLFAMLQWVYSSPKIVSDPTEAF